MAQLLPSMDIDMLPGPQDPASNFLPQQALHPSLFQKSSLYSTFHSVTNPYAFEVNETEYITSNVE